MVKRKMNDCEKRRNHEKTRDCILGISAVFHDVPRKRIRRYSPKTADFRLRIAGHVHKIPNFVQMFRVILACPP